MSPLKSDNASLETQFFAEIEASRSGRQNIFNEFEDAVGMLEGERIQKAYDWMSNVSLPEYASHVFTQTAIDSERYFKSRDFVECYLEDGSPDAQAKAASAKECLNRTLNQRHLYYYLKFLRAREINNMVGHVVARCWWEQERQEKVSYVKKERPMMDTISGEPLMDEVNGVPMMESLEEPTVETTASLDRFNFDLYDPRNVFMDNSYVYSIQDKKWVTVRWESSLSELRQDAEKMGYVNLDELESILYPAESDTSKESFNKEKAQIVVKNKSLDVYERYGKLQVIITKRNEQNQPIEIKSGLDREGKPLDGSELIETIVTFAKVGGQRQLIRFQPQPYMDAFNKPYRPLIMGLCYPHPSKSEGLGESKYAKQLQSAIDDTFNISNDRVMLATLPVLKVRKVAMDDMNEVVIEPNRPLLVEDGPDDITELRISDNIQGSMQQIGMLRGMYQQLDAMNQISLGGMPEAASTTATAVGGAEARTNTRTNLKSMLFEYTFLTELYWIILQMTNQFAFPETGERLMGEKVVDFDPSKEFFYKPLSQAIESEFSKQAKVTKYVTVLGYLIQTANPNTPKIVNFILKKIFELSGDEFEEFGEMLFDTTKPLQTEGGPVGVSEGQMPNSNQRGTPMSGMESEMRGVMQQ